MSANAGWLMVVMVGPMAMVAVVLLASAVLKLQHPDPAREALRRVGLPGGLRMARLLGVVELIVAVGALAVGGPLAGASVAGLFVVFTVASWRLVADAGSAETCGCFGRFSAPPSRLHVAVNVASMAVAVLATIEGAPSLRATIRDEGRIGWALSGLAILGGLTALAMMTVLPAALAAAGDAPASGKAVGLFRVRGVAE